MNLTKHAKKRMRQRGLSRDALSIIEYYGKYSHAPGGAIKITFGKKEHQKATSELKQMQQLIDKAKDSGIIYDEPHDTAITTFKQT